MSVHCEDKKALSSNFAVDDYLIKHLLQANTGNRDIQESLYSLNYAPNDCVFSSLVTYNVGGNIGAEQLWNLKLRMFLLAYSPQWEFFSQINRLYQTIDSGRRFGPVYTNILIGTDFVNRIKYFQGEAQIFRTCSGVQITFDFVWDQFFDQSNRSVFINHIYLWHQWLVNDNKYYNITVISIIKGASDLYKWKWLKITFHQKA